MVLISTSKSLKLLLATSTPFTFAVTNRLLCTSCMSIVELAANAVIDEVIAGIPADAIEVAESNTASALVALFLFI